MKKMLYLLLAVLMLVTTLAGCADMVVDPPTAQPTTPDDPYMSRLKGLNAYDEFVFGDYVITTSHSNSMYNRITKEGTHICGIKNCSSAKEGCPLREIYSSSGVTHATDGFIRVSGVTENRLYFTNMSSSYYHPPYYGYIDMQTHEVTRLLEIDYHEMILTRPMFLDGDWVYLARKHLVKGGFAGETSDYVSCLSRIPADGGREEVIYTMRDSSETLALIVDGYMYTYYQSKLWRTNLETWEQAVLLDLEYTNFDKIGDLLSLDGCLYFIATRDGEKRLMQMDPQTGGWACVVNQPLASYAITNEAVYFIPYEKRQVNDPARYPADGRDAAFASCATSIYTCDHDGGNVRKVWTDESGYMQFASTFTVVDGEYYGRVSTFDPEKNAWSGLYYQTFSFEE